MISYVELQRAVTALAIRCDGAHAEDSQGFNITDSAFGKRLAALPTWTPRQARAAWRMLRKYRVQLSHYAIDYDAIPEPAVPGPTQPEEPIRQIALLTDAFAIRFTYDAALVSAIKSIPGVRFDRTEKIWRTRDTSALTCRSVMTFAAEYDFDLDDAAYHAIEQSVEHAARLAEMSRAEAADFQVDGLGGTLRPFQAAGVRYAVQAKRCIIGDEMGTGKTIQAIATVHALQAFPTLIVCPASLKLNWKREVEQWLPNPHVLVLHGTSTTSLSSQRDIPIATTVEEVALTGQKKGGGSERPQGSYSANIVIINYDVLYAWQNSLIEVGFKSIICDEAHMVKGHRTRRTKAVQMLASGIPVRLMLTGTPFLNRPAEAISLLTILDRLDEFGGWYKFATRYCQAHKTRFGWDLSGASHLEELNARMREVCYIRRLKKDVLKELPAKQRSIVPIEISNPDEYARVEANVLAWIGEQAAQDEAFQCSIANLSESEQEEAKARRRETAAKRAQQAEQLVRIEALKQVAAQGKLAAVQDWVETFLESGEKLVLFAHHREIVKMLAETFKAPSITGETPVADRQAYVDRFQTDPECRLIVLNLRAGGVGLTLTAASHVAFVELGWTPGEMDQSEDRCHRIGQTDNVTAWYLLAEGTIDSDIYELIEEKRHIVEAATDGAKSTASPSIVHALMLRLASRRRSEAR